MQKYNLTSFKISIYTRCGESTRCCKNINLISCNGWNQQNIRHNILETHLTFLFNYFSICPPLAAVYPWSSLLLQGTFLRDFGPFSLKGLLQSFRIIVSSSAGLSLQYGPHTKVQRGQVRRWIEPQFLLRKRRKVTLTFLPCERTRLPVERWMA